ncbi:PA14 domain protein [Aureliella helgolandensis]|uniref:PA14 domain protein n=2 Tax=Aureliella helgolandensis TaxID=2527968 RepID=A0A518GAU0_9BACT|nr:PA14 domain protein [Aureliella helgolandensis]
MRKERPESLLQLASLLLIVALHAPLLRADEGEAQATPIPSTVPSEVEAELSPQLQLGKSIYGASCADCHGAVGEGVEGAYPNALVGDDSSGQLAQLIIDTMPEGEPEACVGEEAAAVAEYIHFAFYSEAAQLRNRPPRQALARLTANQLQQSIADLYALFDGVTRASDKHGLKAEYFAGDRRRDENRKIERIDPFLDFDFGHDSPGEGIEAKSFAIQWEGGVVADVTGRYELVVDSTCSFTLDFGRRGRQLIDNHVQSGEKTEFRRAMTLVAGRVYPISIAFVQRDRKTEIPPARFSLRWVPPDGIEQVIPTRNLVHEWAPPSYALQAELPPDDRSYGFERGIAVNRAWDESTTMAAVEFAEIAAAELWPEYERRHRKEPNENRQQLKNFLAEIVQAAFRRELTDDLRQRHVERQVDAEPGDAEAIKRVVLLCLKSPLFLYPTLDGDCTPSRRAANRLALVLYDSLPTDKTLLKLVAEQKFATREQIRNYVWGHLQDYRVYAKTHEMMIEWLNLAHLQELSKSDELFPGFDKELAVDLQRSLDLFLEEVVWGESDDYRQLFNADWAFTTPRLANFYGETWQPATARVDEAPAADLQSQAEPGSDSPPAAEESAADDSEATGGEQGAKHLVGLKWDSVRHSQLQRSVADDQHRFGLLTHPYLMSGLAYHDSTSPIHRGVFLIRYVLGRTLRPPNEAFTPLSPDLHPDLTTRERVALQTSPESCQVCHVKINGLGFTLENYDAVGRFRVDEKQKPINSQGSYTIRSGKTVEFIDAAGLSAFLTESEDAQRAFVSKAFQHFVKQPPAALRPTALEELTTTFRESDFSIRQLIVEIAVMAAEDAAREREPAQQTPDTAE